MFRVDEPLVEPGEFLAVEVRVAPAATSAAVMGVAQMATVVGLMGIWVSMAGIVVVGVAGIV
jgi:hypothetical protein